jgi:hypothetical protein
LAFTQAARGAVAFEMLLMLACSKLMGFYSISLLTLLRMELVT